MLIKIKRALKREKQKFHKICKHLRINLDYQINKTEFRVFKAIFEDREYADYFPFYREVTVLDIGAHYGYFSIFAHLNTDKKSTIITIEPSKHNFEQLNKNINFANIKNINAQNCAVGGERGNIKLFIGKNINHSIIKDYSLSKSNEKFEMVEVRTLEDIMSENNLEKIDFLKLDCEGAEYSILENTPKHVFEKIITISMEFHDMNNKQYTGERIIKILKENNFEVVKYQYEKTALNLNYGKIIGTKILKA